MAVIPSTSEPGDRGFKPRHGVVTLKCNVLRGLPTWLGGHDPPPPRGAHCLSDHTVYVGVPGACKLIIHVLYLSQYKD